MPFLTATTGLQAGSRFELSNDEVVIGRDPTVLIHLDFPSVSRKHARILRQGADFLVEDLKSRNGTLLNGVPVPVEAPQRLKEGDQLRICDVEFTFHRSPSIPPAFTPVEPQRVEGSSIGVFLVDDPVSSAATGSRIFRSSDSSSRSGTMQIVSSPEAKLAAILRISRNLGRALALDEVLPSVLQTLFEIFPQADRGFIVLVEPDGTLVPRWTHTRREQDSETVRISRTIIRSVMETGEPLLSEDASQDSKFDVSASVADLRIRSMICAPLLDSEGKSIGALQIDSLNSRFRFSAEDLDLLASVAAQAGIAIRNAQLHEFALHQATEKAKVEEDLLRAWQVQQAFLPNTQPALPGFHFFNYYQPATYIGGDYYDYIPLSNDRVAVVVADVVGHGVAAAMLMAKLAAECRFCLASEPDPALAITRLNREICSLTTERFITFLLTVYNPRERQMTIVNAGHMAPIILRSNGEIIEPGEEESGIVLGVDGDWNYDAISVDLDPGDTVVMYTDGINEAHNPANAQFGIERIRERLKTEKDHSTIGSGIIKSVTEFMAGAPQGDDMCLVVLHRGSMAE